MNVFRLRNKLVLLVAALLITACSGPKPLRTYDTPPASQFTTPRATDYPIMQGNAQPTAAIQGTSVTK